MKHGVQKREGVGEKCFRLESSVCPASVRPVIPHANWVLKSKILSIADTIDSFSGCHFQSLKSFAPESDVQCNFLVDDLHSVITGLHSRSRRGMVGKVFDQTMILCAAFVW